MEHRVGGSRRGDEGGSSSSPSDDGKRRKKDHQRVALDGRSIGSVYRQDHDGTHEALRNGDDPDARLDDGGENVVHHDGGGNDDSLLASIQHGAGTDAFRGDDGNGLSPLPYAVVRGDDDAVRLPWDGVGADPDPVGTPRRVVAVAGHSESIVLKPLQCARPHGHFEKDKVLVKSGARVNDDDVGVTAGGDGIASPLHRACDAGHVDAVRYLIERCDADPFRKDRDGKLPIHLACEMKRKRVVDFLSDACEFFPDTPDSEGNTCLHWACRRSDGADRDSVQDLVRSLVHRMPSIVDAVNRRGQTALHFASFWDADLCRVLVETHGADPTKKDAMGRTPLIDASRRGGGGTETAIARYLAEITAVRCPDRINNRDDAGWTALHWAAFRHDERLIRILLESGADANTPSFCGRRPLHLVTGSHFPAGLDRPDPQLDGALDRTMVFPPRRRRGADDESVAALLEGGADVIVSDDRGDLPFFASAATGSVPDAYVMLRAATGRGLFNHYLSGTTTTTAATATATAPPPPPPPPPRTTTIN